MGTRRSYKTILDVSANTTGDAYYVGDSEKCAFEVDVTGSTPSVTLQWSIDRSNWTSIQGGASLTSDTEVNFETFGKRWVRAVVAGISSGSAVVRMGRD